MSGETSIEWTDSTWNPTVGCTKVSAGCDHCYAETLVNRFAGSNKGFPNRFDEMFLRGDKTLMLPLRWSKPRRIFVNSLSDLFHDDVPDEFIARVFTVMALAHWHTYQLLTKRHARMRSLLNSDRFRKLLDDAWCDAPDFGMRIRESAKHPLDVWPLPNVWLGVSIESQQWADIRIPALLDTPAAVRFLSCEPLLGPIDLDNCGGYQAVITPGEAAYSRRLGYPDLTHIDWVICGGESGPGARPMHPDWARSLRDQCVTAGVPFLFKQWGNWAPAGEGITTIGRYIETERQRWLPGATDPRFTHSVMERVGKKAAGRELDGRTWDDYPAESFPREYPEVTR